MSKTVATAGGPASDARCASTKTTKGLQRTALDSKRQEVSCIPRPLLELVKVSWHQFTPSADPRRGRRAQSPPGHRRNVFLEGRTAIVTGSTGEGMGRQIAWTFAREGANVVLNYGTYRKSDALAKKAVQECEALGGRAMAVRADTRKEADIVKLVKAAETEFGQVDIAVANAGGDLVERDLEDTSLAEWKKVVDAELDGAFLLAREVIPAMRKRKDGRIVFISWDKAASPSALPYDYAIGKGARDLLASKLARAERRHGILVNTVAPGAVAYPSDAQSRDYVRHGKQWPSRKQVTNQDVAEAVLWLCRDEARHVHGSRIELS